PRDRCRGRSAVSPSCGSANERVPRRPRHAIAVSSAPSMLRLRDRRAGDGPARSRRTWLSGARVERRLAAIPGTDVAGCSRLMGEDDAGTLARLAGVAHAMCDVLDELVADLG